MSPNVPISRDSSTLCFNILRYLVLLQPYVQYRPLCPIYAKSCQYPKISLLLALIKKYVEKKPNLYAILWKMLTFIKFCGDYYDIYENKIICISNASWEILNRMFFNGISKYSGG